MFDICDMFHIYYIINEFYIHNIAEQFDSPKLPLNQCAILIQELLTRSK